VLDSSWYALYTGYCKFVGPIGDRPVYFLWSNPNPNPHPNQIPKPIPNVNLTQYIRQLGRLRSLA